MTRFTLAAASLALAALTAAAPMPAQADTTEAQLAEIRLCASFLGYTGPVAVADGRALPSATTSSGSAQIGARDAHMINRCVAERAREPRAPIFPVWGDSHLCFRDAPLLYRGNLYCFDNR